MKRSILVAASLLAMAATTGCKREASGQVVAVVNGDEITRQEVDAELNGKPLPQNVDTKEAQRLLLQRVIDRRLLAGAARADGIDKDQEYLLKQRRLDDVLLGDLLAERTARTFRIPDNAAIDKYVAAHPTVFGQREILQVDQIVFPPPSDFKQIEQLKDDHSLDAVATKLTSLGIKFNRTRAGFDTAIIEPALLARIKQVPSGEPFILPQPGAISVNVLTGTTSVPLQAADARPLAVQLMRKDAVDDAVKARMKSAKAEAKIEYQAGFGPPKTAKN